MNPQIDPNEQDAVVLWAEIWRLRTALRGPDGYATWQDAAVAERARRIQAERSASARVALSDKVLSLLAKVPLPPKAITYEYGWELLDALQECAVEAATRHHPGAGPSLTSAPPSLSSQPTPHQQSSQALSGEQP